MSEPPEDWKELPLGDLGKWFGGGTPSKHVAEYWDNGTVPWLSPKDMSDDVLASTKDKISESAVANSAAKLLPPGVVAVVMRSGILERTIPVTLVPFATTLNQDMKAVVPNSDVEAKWIAWGLRAFENQLLLQTRKAGTTVASLEYKRLLAFKLPVPPLEEQRRIVAILEDHLTHLDSAVDSLKAARTKSQRLHDQLMERFFGSRVAELVPLADLVEQIEAGKSLGTNSWAAREGEWAIIKVSAMTYGEFRPSENKAIPENMANPSYEIHKGDLLVSRANTAELVGASVMVRDTPPKLLLSDKSLRVHPKPGISTEWLWRVLQSPSSRKQISALATGTKDSMRNISQKALLKIQVPSVIREEQERAVVEFNRSDEEVSRLGQSLGAMEPRANTLRRSLLAAAFRGDLTAEWRENRPAESVGSDVLNGLTPEGEETP